MIFNSNTTSLGSTIPMAEGYDGSIGCAKALIESAQNDYAMFRAMLESDAREIQAMKSGYVNESEIISLQEATIGGIWNKIKELFKKLIAKIKSIFANFLAKFRGLYMKDKELVKTYGQQVMRKSNLGNMSIKWRKTKDNENLMESAKTYENASPDDVVDKLDYYALQEWSSDTDKRWETITLVMKEKGKFIGDKSDGPSEYRQSIEDAIWEDNSPDEYDFKDIFSGAREMINSFDGGSKLISKCEKYVAKLTKVLDKRLKEYDKFANQASKDVLDKNRPNSGGDYKWNYSGKKLKTTGGAGDDTDIEDRIVGSWDGNTTAANAYKYNLDNIKNKYDAKHGKAASTGDEANAAFEMRAENASHEYDMAVVFNDAVLIYSNVQLEAIKEYYKQLKAVFMKAVTVSDKKLEESSIYAQAVAEAAEDEVEDVITKELSKHDNWLSSTSNAPETVLDPGVGGYELGYEPDKWTDDYITPPTAGSKDSTIVGTSESAYFGSLLY